MHFVYVLYWSSYFSRNVENLSPPLPNPLLLGEGSGFIFFAERGFDFSPFPPLSSSPFRGDDFGLRFLFTEGG